ncbi:hypothetical protein OH491_17525 [Termitidicoccus mucosus]|uniref:Uncharacterized protein n=1 Tax=Termitidicoccus mucosus TaxID=1184151 RepID=A0A178IIX2_9BACT|nr:hypothetical protein AW736_11075 [Opitutaceae bacterium TSB47]
MKNTPEVLARQRRKAECVRRKDVAAIIDRDPVNFWSERSAIAEAVAIYTRDGVDLVHTAVGISAVLNSDDLGNAAMSPFASLWLGCLIAQAFYGKAA